MERKLYRHKIKGLDRVITVHEDLISIEIIDLMGLPFISSDTYSSLYKSFLDLIELESCIIVHESVYNDYFYLKSLNYYLEPGNDTITLYTDRSNLITSKSGSTRVASEFDVFRLKEFISNIFYGATVL